VKVYHFPEETAQNHGTWSMLITDLLEAPMIHTGEWQAMDTSKSVAHKTHELEDVSLVWDRLPQYAETIVPDIDIEWASEHFRERTGGEPVNPAPSHVRWPYAVRGNADHTDASTRFDHTYPERFWPKFAGAPDGRGGDMKSNPQQGIRFNYGDLNDVVDLLIRSPLTRQAYLPIFFPEDTGAVEGQRVPCTLGYHFMQRGGRLTCRYYMRSCDVYRHLANDIYLAARLTEWVCQRVSNATRGTEAPLHFRPGGLVMHISSLHSFLGDTKKIMERLG